MTDPALRPALRPPPRPSPRPAWRSRLRLAAPAVASLTALLLLAGFGAHKPASPTGSVPSEAQRPDAAGPLVAEFRSYSLQPGSGEAFHRIVMEEAVPMLERWGVDVVAFGPSLHDPDAYYLIRAYAALEDRERSHEAFYGSAEWQEGPRDRVLALIDAYTTVVVGLDRAGLESLRLRHGQPDAADP